MRKIKRMLCLLLAACMLFCFALPAFAATTTTITDEDIPYDYFEYYNSGWHDLNTPVHRDAQGNYAYCLDHQKEPPGSSTQYSDFDASLVFTPTVIKGIQAILDHGYPISTGGLSSSKAHYATANAIRMWIKEATGVGFNFMDPGSSNLRAKSGANDCWTLCLQLLGYARAGSTTGGGGSGGEIVVSSANLKWSLSGGQLVTQLTVQAPDGYTITPSSGSINIQGYTGGTYDVLTITAPLSMMGVPVSLFIQGKSGGSSGTYSAKLYWYEPNQSAKQRVVVTELVHNSTPDSGTVNITGEFYDLTINKTDGYTGSALDGAVFQLLAGGSPVGLVQTSAGRYTAGGSMTQLFTTSGGSAAISGLPSGSYTLVEVSAPGAEYTMAANGSIQLYGNTTATVPNNPTKITVVKTNGLTKAPMPGVTFTLTDGAGNPVKLSKHADGTYRPDVAGSNSFQVDSAGRATIMYLPKGNYIIHELATTGYAELTTSNFVLNGEVTINAVNDPLALTLTKVDSFTGKNLAGIPFTLLDSSGTPVKLTKQSDGLYHYDTSGSVGFESGANGTASIYYIPAGVYTVRETTSLGLGYAEAKDVSATVTVQNGSANAATVRFANDPITLEFTKADALTKLPLDGAVFQLKDNVGGIVKLIKVDEGSYKPDDSGEDTFSTHNGEAVIRYLTPQTYTISELTPPDGYTKDSDKTVAVSDKNDVSNAAKASMMDKPLALEFTKTDQLTGAMMDGCEFSLKDADGKIIKLRKVSDGVYTPDTKGSSTFTTFEGKVKIGPISPGAYTISETNAKAGFAPAADVTVTVTDANESSNPAKAAMANVPLAVVLHKLDSETKAPIAGTQFKLLDQDGDAVKLSAIVGKAGWYMPDSSGSEMFAMPSSGSVTVCYLPLGKYTLQEAAEIPGYAKLKDAVKLEVMEENTYAQPCEVTVENTPLAVEVTKTDGTDGTPLPNVSLKITNDAGIALKFIKVKDGEYRVSKDGGELFQTGADGKSLIKLIPEGNYTLEEVDNPGFGRVNPVPFVVEQNNTIDTPTLVGLENFPLYFELTKLDKISKAPLSGVPFKLLNTEGKPLCFTKQADGTYGVTPAGAETFTTDDQGKAIISYIPVGVYTLEEQEYDGYGILKPVAVTIADTNTKDNAVKLELENIPLAVEILKVDSYTKKVMEGMSFKLFDPAGKQVKLALMSTGVYWPLEKAKQYKPPIENPPTATPTSIEKEVDVFTTNKDGIARIEYLSLGKYKLEEQSRVGYLTLSNLEFEMKSSSTMIEPLQYAIANVPTRLLIEKQDGFTKLPLVGAKFKLTDKDGKVIPLIQNTDGTFRPAGKDEKGIEMFELNSKAQATILYLPAGEVTVVETECPAGYNMSKPIKAEVGTEKVMNISLEAQAKGEDENIVAETSVAVTDMPLALKISKIHSKTKKPLKGAAFQLKTSGALATPLKFTLKNGVYWYDTKGTVTTIELNEKCEALLMALPVGKYVLEETVVPANFFPAVPVNIEITLANTSEAPNEVIVTNTPTVKLGIDSDKFDVVIAIVATILILGIGGTVLFIRRRRGNKQQEFF